MNNFEKYLLSDKNLNEIDEHFSDLMELVFEFINNLDIENLDENQSELLDEILEMYEDDELSEVAGKKKKVVRGGKRTKKISCPKGYKAVGGKCVKMSSSEKKTRERAAKKSAKKKKGKGASIERKRKRSMRKR